MKKKNSEMLRELIDTTIKMNEVALDSVGLYRDVQLKNTDDKAAVFIHRILEMYQEGAADNGIHLLVAWTLYRHALSDLYEFLSK